MRAFISASLRAAALLPALLLVPATKVLAHGEVDEVLREIDRLIAERPEDAALHLRRGELNRSRGGWEAALADFERARRIDPGLHQVDLFLGRLWRESGDPMRACEALDRFLANEPGDAFALALKGRALLDAGRHLEAAGALDLAVAAREATGIDPDPEIYALRARALEASGGAEDLQRALGGLEEGLNRLGRPLSLETAALDLEVRSRRMPDALKRLDRLARTAPRPEPWLVRRAEVLESMERLDEARESYRAALAGIEGLPAAKRATAGFETMEQRVRSALERLTAKRPDEPGGARLLKDAGGSR